MADFLVTIDGKYLYCGIVRYFDAPELLQGIIDEAKEYLGLPKDFDKNRYDAIFNDKTGRVEVFGKHMAVYNTETRKSSGYMEIEKFWQNAKPSKEKRTYTSTNDAVDLRYYRKFEGTIITTVPMVDKVSPKEGDRIILANRVISDVQGIYKLKTTIKSFTYPSTSHNLYDLVKDGLDYIVDSGIDKSTHIISNDNFLSHLPNFNNNEYVEDLSVVANYHLGVFYSNILANGFIRPGDESATTLLPHEINYVESITLLFQHLFKINSFTDKLQEYNFEFLFEKFFQIFHLPINSNGQVMPPDEYYDSYGTQYFEMLYLRLHEFYLWAKGALFVTEYGMLTRIMGLFDKNVLKYLDYSKKLELLKLMLVDNEFLSGRWNLFLSENKLTEEEVVVKIIESIKRKEANGALNYTEINDFMDKLNNSPFYETTTSPRTLFEVLYNKVDDDILFGDDGNGAKGQMIKAIYGLWADSKYNPSNDLIPESQRIMPNHTTYNATWKYDDPDITSKSLDFSAKPLIINYESDKVLLWYNDNFEFPFYKNQILAAREEWKDGSEMILQTLANVITPFKNFDYTKYIPFGFYNIFDTVAIRNTNSDDTIIKIPLSVESLQNPCIVNENINRNEIPIFFLKYVNDLANYSNVKETIGTTIDVVLTFSGVGNITKLRYLQKASVIRRYLTPSLRPLLPAVERQLISRTIRQVAFASWEIVLGTAGILHSMTTNSCQGYLDPCNPPQPGSAEYEKYQDCQAIQGWLLALEIFTLAGDLYAKRYFRKKSFELRQRITEQKINDFPAHLIDNDVPVSKQQVNEFLDEISDLTVEYNKFYNNLPAAVRNKLDSLNFSEKKKYDFWFDFDGKSIAINKLGSNQGIPIERWSNLYDLKAVDRANIEVLTTQSLYNNLTKFCNKPKINEALNALSFERRKRFVNKYNATQFNFSEATLNRINNSPSRFELMLSHMENPRIGQKNMFDNDDIKAIVESNLSDIHVDILEIKISISMKLAKETYKKKILNIPISKAEAKDMFNCDFGQFDTLADGIKSKIKQNNKYITETKIYNDNTLVSTVNENFISSDFSSIKEKFNNNVPDWLTNPNQTDLDIFSRKSFELKSTGDILKNNDTELKYIFNFLENHWNSGNKFVITGRSALYTCGSCQGYLVYLQKLAEKHGKSITFKVMANPEAITMKILKKF